MGPLVKIKAVSKLDGRAQPVRGHIKILNRTDDYIYASWRLLDDANNTVAAVTRRYYLKDHAHTDEEATLILTNISLYRIGRRKIFEQVEIVK